MGTSDEDKMKKEVHQAEGRILDNMDLETEEPIPEVEWAPVARDLEPIQAELLKEDLKEAGIPVVVTGGSMDSFPTYPDLENAVLVPKSMLEEANPIVGDFLARMAGEKDLDVCSSCGAEVPPEAETCPNCGEAFTGEIDEEQADAEMDEDKKAD